jgi:hypothetical protein
MFIWELLRVRGNRSFTVAVVIAVSEIEARGLISESAGWDPLDPQQLDWTSAQSVVCRQIGTATEETKRIVVFVQGNFLSTRDKLLDDKYARIKQKLR